MADLFWDFFLNYMFVFLGMTFTKKNKEPLEIMKSALIFTVVVFIIFKSILYFSGIEDFGNNLSEQKMKQYKDLETNILNNDYEENINNLYILD